jgi:hypothetical protein
VTISYHYHNDTAAMASREVYLDIGTVETETEHVERNYELGSGIQRQNQLKRLSSAFGADSVDEMIIW